MRLIDGDALEQFFLHECHRLQEYLKSDEHDKEEEEYIRTFLPTVEWARKTVHHVTTINPEELRSKGQWIERVGLGEWVCSECQHEIYLPFGETPEEVGTNYCPSCGSRMEE